MIAPPVLVLALAVLVLQQQCPGAVHVTPRQAFLGDGPVVVTATTERLPEQLRCAPVEWDWDDGSFSGRASDASAEVDCEARASASHAYFTPGRYEIVATFRPVEGGSVKLTGWTVVYGR